MPSKQDDSDLVLFECLDSTAILTMNRPEYRNAQNLALLVERRATSSFLAHLPSIVI
jgi:enoyl-CoA hydratase/carnithine racemase